MKLVDSSHKGITVYENNNGFVVCRVHYSADPAKDPDTPEGMKWYEKERRGFPDSKWRKEYEIEWHALSGDLVYPDFKRDGRNSHVIRPFRIPPDWRIYMAIDPGLRNPTAALWAAVDEDDNVIFFSEYYKRERSTKDHAEEMLRIEASLRIKPFVRLIDPSACTRSLINMQNNRNEYASHGVYCIPANNDIQYGIDIVSKYLLGEDGIPQVYFFNTLKHTIEEMLNYRWEETSAHMEAKKNSPEKPIKKKDHLMDCLRYILTAKPHAGRRLDNYLHTRDVRRPKPVEILGQYTGY